MPPAPVNQEIQNKIVGDEEIVTVRPAQLLDPEIEKAKTELGDRARGEEDVLSYALFPKIFLEFAELREKGFPLEEPKVPSPAMREGQPYLAPTEFMIHIHGEAHHIKVGGKGHRSEGKRPYFLYVDSQLYEVLVEPLVEIIPTEEGKLDLKATGQSIRPQAQEPGDITAAMPGNGGEAQGQEG